MKQDYKIVVVLSIDDIDLITINRENKSKEEVIVRAQLILDYWQARLEVTRWELKLSKCFWMIQANNLKNSSCSYKESIEFQITIQQGDKRVPI